MLQTLHARSLICDDAPKHAGGKRKNSPNVKQWEMSYQDIIFQKVQR